MVWHDMVYANYVVLKRFFLESSSNTMKSAVFSSIITALVMKRYANVRTKYSLQNFQRISFLSLLRQLKLNIPPFFLDFSHTQKNGFRYSLLLLLSCFESIFILNTDTETKCMYTN